LKVVSAILSRTTSGCLRVKYSSSVPWNLLLSVLSHLQAVVFSKNTEVAEVHCCSHGVVTSVPLLPLSRCTPGWSGPGNNKNVRSYRLRLTQKISHCLLRCAHCLLRCAARPDLETAGRHECIQVHGAHSRLLSTGSATTVFRSHYQTVTAAVARGNQGIIEGFSAGYVQRSISSEITQIRRLHRVLKSKS